MRINSPKLNIMYKACMKASKFLIRDFGEVENLQVSSKGPGDFVSSADKRTEKIIIEEILKAYPDHGILSEEVGKINQKNKNNRWIIDPIDGTSNFLNAIPQFAISIGYEEDSQIKNGLIYDPIKNELFFAETGSGAFLNNSRIRVSKKKSLKQSLLGTGGPRSSSKIKNKIFNEFIEISKNVSNCNWSDSNVNGPHQLSPCVTTRNDPAQPLSPQSCNVNVLLQFGVNNVEVASSS